MKTIILASLLILAALPGCKGAAEVVKALPPGTQLQSSTFGLKFSPQAADGTPFVIGSHSTIFSTAQPDNAPNLNRFEGRAPLISTKSTVATGAVGEQIREAGGPDALKILIGPPPGLNIRDKVKVHKPPRPVPPEAEGDSEFRAPSPRSTGGAMTPWPDERDALSSDEIDERLRGWALGSKTGHADDGSNRPLNAP